MEFNACKSCQFYSSKTPDLAEMKKQPKTFRIELSEIESILSNPHIFNKSLAINAAIFPTHYCEYQRKFLNKRQFMIIKEDGCELHAVSYGIYMSVYTKDKQKARDMLDADAQKRLKEIYPYLR
ncbi:hypothetical protein [Bacillus cereus]|uniref:Uncharacterized protein n=1 Tax=Bacillus cereus TaxID=1396 RepID=A0A164QCQ1_BACCE|nr:hypothetical protein [Bacillus cereus]KZD70960.1 hypothetical protein B4088_1016 [Bacillus cereus]